MTLRFDHAGLETVDIEADVRFFTETIGMTLIRWGSHFGTGKRIAMLRDAHGVKVELIEVAEALGAYAHTAFATDDIEGSRDSVEATGCEIVTRLVHIEAARAQSALVKSPAGSAIQIIQYEEGSPDLAV